MCSMQIGHSCWPLAATRTCRMYVVRCVPTTHSVLAVGRYSYLSHSDSVAVPSIDDRHAMRDVVCAALHSEYTKLA